MISRRNFLASTAATLATPSLVRAFELDPILLPQEVRVGPSYAPGQLLVLPKAHFLYFITAPRTALRYGVGVGKAGLDFTGTATISVKKEWPTWRPTNEMIERDPRAYGKFKDNDYVQPAAPAIRLVRARSISSRMAATPISASMAPPRQSPLAARFPMAASA